MDAYATYANGKIKYYWEGNSPSVFLDDPIDGLRGAREWLLDVIPDKESILDIGCGSGHVSEIFKRARRNNEYIGIDNNIKFIEQARLLFSDYQFDCQDANFLPYKDNSFDNCILFTVIEMLADFRRPIDEAVRVAKKRIIITLFISLTDKISYNKHKVNSYGDYVVKINEKKFIDYIKSFGYSITYLELVQEGKIQYWCWIINKDE